MEARITTFSGYEVDPLNLRPDDIRIEDVAHGLALCNRFAGQSRYPISVAQHSILVSLLIPDMLQPVGGLIGLLHDGSEAYLGDVTKWLKQTKEMEAYRNAEKWAQIAVYRRFGITDTAQWDSELESADRLAVRYEFELAFGRPQNVEGYGGLSQGEEERLRRATMGWLWRPFMTWQEAEAAFLVRFRQLLGETR